MRCKGAGGGCRSKGHPSCLQHPPFILNCLSAHCPAISEFAEYPELYTLSSDCLTQGQRSLQTEKIKKECLNQNLYCIWWYKSFSNNFQFNFDILKQDISNWGFELQVWIVGWASLGFMCLHLNTLWILSYTAVIMLFKEVYLKCHL